MRINNGEGDTWFNWTASIIRFGFQVPNRWKTNPNNYHSSLINMNVGTHSVSGSSLDFPKWEVYFSEHQLLIQFRFNDLRSVKRCHSVTRPVEHAFAWNADWQTMFQDNLDHLMDLTLWICVEIFMLPVLPVLHNVGQRHRKFQALIPIAYSVLFFWERKMKDL